MRVAVCCGGTGGHAVPGIAAGRALERRGHHVTLWLSGRGEEALALGDWAVETVSVPVAPPGRLKTARAAAVAWGYLRAWMRWRREVRTRRPDVVLAMGSYASVLPVRAATAAGVPVVLHEANAVAGKAVRFLARRAAVIATTFPDTIGVPPGVRTERTGLPLREGLIEAAEGVRASRGVGVVRLLVMGGSQGARFLNQTVPMALAQVIRTGVELRVTHLAGRREEQEVRAAYAAQGVEAEVWGYRADMGAVYGAADMAMSRSGAGACMELAACGVPALLVPLPHSARDHQRENARRMAAWGAAEVLEQKGADVETLARRVAVLAGDAGRLACMRETALRIDAAGGAERLAAVVEAIHHRRCLRRRHASGPAAP